MVIFRNIISELEADADRPEIVVLLGPRQVGKTTVMLELERRLRERGRKTAFFDLEQPVILAGFNRPDAEIVERLLNAGEVIFIDEFQYLPNASSLLKAVYDSRRGIKVFCSGSSAIEIHSHLKESLAGRRHLVRMFPMTCVELAPIGRTFAEYLVYGGMPGLLNADDDLRRQRILEELLGSYIFKDVKSLIREENLRAFNHFMYLLAQNQGSVVSVHSLASEVGLSSSSLNRYLDILESTYVNFRVPSYSCNLGNELKKSFKTYLYDNGMRNSILKDFSALHTRSDKGILHESHVFLTLLARRLPNEEIRFWRTREGDEVDFVLVRDRHPIPIEVKSGVSGAVIPKGLGRFLKRYQVPHAFVINETLSTQIQPDATVIHFMTFDEFSRFAAEPQVFNSFQ